MTFHRIKLKNLDAEFIRRLQEEAQDEEAELTIWLSEKPAGEHLSESEFWKIIDMIDWREGQGDQTVIASAVQHLSTYSVEAIQDFEDHLSYKLYLLDGQRFAENTGENAYMGEDQPFSVDIFLYARCFVVAKGEEFYNHVLTHPEDMPKNRTFEPLLTIAGKAYYRKTEQKWEYIPSHIIETFANVEGWNGKGLIEKILS